MNQQIVEYKEFENIIKENLEQKYQMEMIQGEVGQAYETLGEMMKFKVLDPDDPRLDNKNKLFKSGGVDPHHRFTFDYRKSTSYMPAWLFGVLKTTGIMHNSTIEHIGTRLENGYSGDTVFKSFDIRFRARLCSNTKEVVDTIENIAKLYFKLTGKKAGTTNLMELCKAGVYRIYKLEVEGNCISQYRNVGYVVIMVKDGNIHSNMFINYESLINLWVSIKDFTRSLTELLKDIAGCVTFSYAVKADRYINQQEGLVKSKQVGNKATAAN